MTRRFPRSEGYWSAMGEAAFDPELAGWTQPNRVTDWLQTLAPGAAARGRDRDLRDLGRRSRPPPATSPAR